MGRVLIDAAMSLDGFWADAAGQSVFPVDEMHESGLIEPIARRCGAVVMSRRSFEMADDPDWYADNYELQVPIFVVTDDPPKKTPKGNDRLSFEFVADFATALTRARLAALPLDVVVIGEASAVQSALSSGAADEIYLRIVSRETGGGTPLFVPGMPDDRFHAREIVETPGAVHLHLQRSAD